MTCPGGKLPLPGGFSGLPGRQLQSYSRQDGKIFRQDGRLYRQDSQNSARKAHFYAREGRFSARGGSIPPGKDIMQQEDIICAGTESQGTGATSAGADYRSVPQRNFEALELFTA
ncbi:hypothetical protein [Anaerophaga thermohalophila]|uniref:hypothetical protein n=1 Tax=Anaerophaga thermohalophila TaxID=177400 RepID=UPI0011473B1E|nr:hypothetical protein [Anaerophaga thermohalophila]